MTHKSTELNRQLCVHFVEYQTSLETILDELNPFQVTYPTSCLNPLISK